MKNTYAIISACLAMGAGAASGDILALEGAGTIEQFSGSFAGADQFPFIGLNDGDAISFRYQFDTTASAVSFDGLIANYAFSGDGSLMQLGSSMLTFDSMTMRVGTTTSGGGEIELHGFNSALGVSASVSFFSSSAMAMDLPTSFDFNSFDSFREFDADSNLNQFLLPIAFGTLDSAQIVPTPGMGSFIAAGLLIGLRHRRG